MSEKLEVSQAENPTQLAEEIQEELRRYLKREIVLPEPNPALLEMRKILTGKGFNVDPIVYVLGDQAAYALLDTSTRPDSEEGRQLYSEDFKADGEDGPLAAILRSLRASGKIAISSWTSRVPPPSRFGVSWTEVDQHVAPAIVNVSPHLENLIEATGAQVRVPTIDEFRFAGRLRYSHFGEANTREWLYDLFGVYGRLVSGRYDQGGLDAFNCYHPDIHRAGTAFRFQVVLPSQTVL